MTLLSRPMAAGSGATLRLARCVPGLYDAVHFGLLRNGGRGASVAGAVVRSGLVRPLQKHLDQNPAELVISVGPPGAVAMNALAGRYPALRHVVLCGDAAPHRLWVGEHVDLYLLTSAGAEPHVRKFAPATPIATIPPPVRSEFYRALARPAARIGLGIADEDRCVLLIMGSRGIGALAGIAAKLIWAGFHVIVVAGRNARLEGRLRQLASGPDGGRLTVFGYTDRVAELMAAADLVITGPGSVCAEARTVGRPLLLLDSVPGHGRENLLAEVARGSAAITPPGPDAVAAAAAACLSRDEPPVPGPVRSVADWETLFCGALELVCG